MSDKFDYIVFSNLFPPEGGGLERASEGLSKYLTNEKNKRVAVVFSASEDKEFLEDNVNCFGFNTFKILHGFYPFIGPKMFSKAFSLFRNNNKAKIIIYGRHFTYPIVIGLLARLMGRKYLYVDTGFEPNSFGSKFANKVIDILDFLVFQFVMRMAETVVFVSETSKKFNRKRLGNWIDKSKVILNGFDEIIVEKYPFSAKEKNVVFATRLVPLKNGNAVADVYLDLAPKYPEWKFYFIGKGSSKLDSYKKEELPKNFIFINELLGQKEFHELLSRSAIYINASFSEGLPLAIIEAGGLGCILTMSNIHHNMEVASVADLEKFSFNARDDEDFKQKLEMSMSASNIELHKQIQKDILENFGNKQVFEKYWKLLK